MPWSPAQHRLFVIAAHNEGVAKAHGMTKGKARRMAQEGVLSAPKGRVAKPRRKRIQGALAQP